MSRRDIDYNSIDIHFSQVHRNRAPVNDYQEDEEEDEDEDDEEEEEDEEDSQL